MRAYEVQEKTPDYSGVVEVERGRPTPGEEEALVRIHACSLNYRDLAVANSEMVYPSEDIPVVPFSDGAGEVVEVGDAVEGLAVGDRVATPFAPNWLEGERTAAKTRFSTGGNIDGALAQYVTFPAETLTELPEHLSYEEGATLTCAGLTAWRALVEDGGLRAGESVLALGTGGVSTFAVQFAEACGARSIVTSSSDEKLERARELGADETINYEETPEWGEAVQELTGGIDHVVEVGGAGTLQRSLEAAGTNGHVHVIGVLTGMTEGVVPGPILAKSLLVEGVSGVGSVAMFGRMVDAIDATGLTPVVDRVFDFDDAREAYRHLESGAHQGKVVVRVA